MGNAWYCKDEPGKDNVAQFELIPWLLGRCATVQDARTLLDRMNLVDTPFCEGLPVASLHWMIADNHECITLESTKDGLHVYDNPAGVLTNNPPFPMQLFALNNYMQLSPKATGNHFAAQPAAERLQPRHGGPWVCRGIFRLSRGLYGRLSCAPTPAPGESEAESVSQFFHILGSVEQQRGCCELDNGKYEITLYTSCCNADKGIYYYTTYENSQITAVDMHKEDMDGTELVSYPLVKEQQIRWMK
mgnify:CR=1 FL=1